MRFILTASFTVRSVLASDNTVPLLCQLAMRNNAQKSGPANTARWCNGSANWSVLQESHHQRQRPNSSEQLQQPLVSSSVTVVCQ